MSKYLTASEVIRFSSAGRDFPTKPVCDCLDDIEETFINDCLGDEMDDYLEALIQEIPDDVEEWACTSYDTDDVVLRNGIYYQSTEDGNSSDPQNLDGWIEFEKFTTTCANSLWTKYLRKILALMVYKCAIPEATYRTSAGGLTIQGQDQKGERAASGSEMAKKQQDIQSRIDAITKNMRIWMANETQSDCDFPTRSECVGCGENEAVGRRRFAFR